MARITVEDCLSKERNRFALVQLAAKRTKQLLNGAKPKIPDTRGNKSIVVALREIAAGEVRFMTDEEMEQSADLHREHDDGSRAPIQANAAAELISEAGGGSNGDKGGEEHRRPEPDFSADDE